ncbi:MAG: hypothetical protein U0W65_08920 [Bacteroidia bacterium]
MKVIKNIFYVSIALFLFTTCKKKTTIIVKVFNPALNEYVEGAVVSLLEIKQSSFLVKGDCNEIATATTDVNGVATFDKEKLRTANKYKYKLAIKESWGISHQDPCGSAREDYLDVGKSQELRLDDYLETEVKIQNNNLLNPSQSGDSLILSVTTANYLNSDGHNQGGGGVFASYSYYGSAAYPYPAYMLSNKQTCNAGKLLIFQRKRKMGIVTTTIDTVKAYPNQTNIIQINW